MDRPKQVDKNYIAVMGKAFSVLELFIGRGGKQETVQFAEISRHFPFAQTTTHRILYSFEKLGYLEKNGVGQYRLSNKLFQLTEKAVPYRYLQSIARSEMHSLMHRHLETVNLGVLEGELITHIDVVLTSAPLRIAALPGERNLPHCTALGKAILAFLTESKLAALFNAGPLVRRTANTITRKGHLLDHLAFVREQGVAFDMEENLANVSCVAAPIFDSHR